MPELSKKFWGGFSLQQHVQVRRGDSFLPTQKGTGIVMKFHPDFMGI